MLTQTFADYAHPEKKNGRVLFFVFVCLFVCFLNLSSRPIINGCITLVFNHFKAHFDL